MFFHWSVLISCCHSEILSQLFLEHACSCGRLYLFSYSSLVAIFGYVFGLFRMYRSQVKFVYVLKLIFRFLYSCIMNPFGVKYIVLLCFHNFYLHLIRLAFLGLIAAPTIFVFNL